MSDRETIVQVLKKAESRIRMNLLLGRLSSGLFALVLVALAFTVLDLVLALPVTAGRAFWVLWFAALAVLLVRSRPGTERLEYAAAEIDRKARLEDEIVSALWFVNHRGGEDPWVDLHIRRAAETARRVDVGRLCPRAVPKASWAAAAGLVLLVVLQFAPPPFVDTLALSRPGPDRAALDEAMVADELGRIDELLAEAERLRPDETIDQLQQIVESMREGGSLEDAAGELRDVRGQLDQENLDLASILEGLEEMGRDLMQSEETAPAGEALRERGLEEAASELERLAEELGGGRTPSEELGEALERASEDPRPGLEQLAEQLAQAAEGLENQDSAAAAEALEQAARSLGELSDMVASQQLTNEAAARMENLQEALERQAGREPQGQPGQEGGEAGAGESEMPGEYTDQEAMAPLGEMPEGAEAGSEMEFEDGEFVPDPTGNVDGVGRAGAPSSDDMQLMNSPGMTFVPSNTGFSPDVKEGAATSLEVQLAEEKIEAQVDESAREGDEGEEEEKEEASRQELSQLEYREVGAELTPAQQDLLSQDRIPREYRNVIKEYFQAIRPAPTQ